MLSFIWRVAELEVQIIMRSTNRGYYFLAPLTAFSFLNTHSFPSWHQLRMLQILKIVTFLLRLKKGFNFLKTVSDLDFSFNQFQYKAWHCNSVCVLEILSFEQWVRACYTRNQTKGQRVLSLKENSRNGAHVNHQKTVEFSSGVQNDFVHGHYLYKALMPTNQSNT